jgi:hypothetical protein
MVMMFGIVRVVIFVTTCFVIVETTAVSLGYERMKLFIVEATVRMRSTAVAVVGRMIGVGPE